MVLILAYLIFISFLIVVAFYLYYTAFSSQAGPVFKPTPIKTVRKMLKLAKVGQKDLVLDLGSGDGRILIEAAKLGAKAIGYEIDPILFWQSKRKIKKAGLSRLTKVYFKSFWQADFNQATVITVYLLPKYMRKLEKVLKKELVHPILIVSNNYQFSRKYAKRSGKLYLYKF